MQELIHRHLEAAGVHPQHIDALKHVGDVTSLSAVAAYWLGLFASFAAPLTTIMGFIATVASTVWFVFRAIDMYWTFRDKLTARRAARQVENKESYLASRDKTRRDERVEQGKEP